MRAEKFIMKASEREVTTYEANYRLREGLFRPWVRMPANILSSRQLIFQMYRRDFLNMYKKSFLGFGWLILSPIISIVSWLMMNATGLLTPGDVGIPYPWYVLLSSSIWGLFMNFFNAGKSTLDAGSSFIMQVRYPHEALLFKQALQEFTNFSISLLVNICVLLIFGVHPSWMMLLFPLFVLPLFFLGAGLGLLMAVIKVVASDLDRIFSLILGFCIYITPIIYAPKTKNQTLQTVINYNPLTYLIGAARDATIYGKVSYWDRYFIAAGAATIFFLIAWRLFYGSEEMIIEKMI